MAWMDMVQVLMGYNMEVQNRIAIDLEGSVIGIQKHSSNPAV